MPISDNRRARLTIGIPTYRDFEGLWCTIEALRLYHDLTSVEILVVDNFGCKLTEEFCRDAGAQYAYLPGPTGTALVKNAMFARATGDVVMCIDSHVLLHPGAIESLRTHFAENPECADLLHGPMIDSTHGHYHVEMADQWRGQMWGVWNLDDIIKPAELPAVPWPVHHMGMGLFACRRDKWLGFNSHFRGFGGEEGYLAIKYRQAGHQCVQIPGLKWSHRFGRTFGIPYPLSVDDKLRNYLIGCRELDIDPTDCMACFADELPTEAVLKIVDDVDRIFSGLPSTREDIVPDSPPLAAFWQDFCRLPPLEQLQVKTRLLSNVSDDRPTPRRTVPPGFRRDLHSAGK